MKAQCLCGAVSLRIIEDRKSHTCHCGKCRMWGSGASFTLTVRSPGITGNEHIAHYQSSEWAQCCFCKRRGTHLFVQADGDYYINAKLFADNAGSETALRALINCKTPHYDLANDTPKLTETEFLEMVDAAGQENRF